ncbi:MAG TPA: hypothetical protein ENI82_06355 [Bacteroidetes bacterium]|nr:hypothetical protein [Bacteroidota bacterium]
MKYTFYLKKTLSFFLFIPFLFFSCKKECKLSPAECHVYENSGSDCTKTKEKNAPVVASLKEIIHPISGSDPTLNMEELSAIGDYIGSAYFVGLGEATHGTREFFQMKDRLFRYLVQNHGFKVMGFEATWGGALYVNQYVLQGIGTAKKTVRKMKFWTWETEEVIALVEWMRAYNLAHPDEEPLQFYGFDMQSVDEEYFWIKDYLSDLDLDLFNSIDTLLKPYVSVADYQTYPSLSETRKNKFKADLVKAKKLFENKESNLVALSSQQEYDLIHQAFVIFIQNEDILDPKFGKGRDFYMARNSEWIRNYVQPRTKVALWAHNGHVTKGDFWAEGAELYEAHAGNYKVIGFSFSKGSFQAYQPKGVGLTTNNVVEEMDCQTVNALMADVGEDNYYIIFDELESTSAAYKYFHKKNPFFMLGSVFYPDSQNTFISLVNLPEHYDILIYFKESHFAKPY